MEVISQSSYEAFIATTIIFSFVSLIWQLSSFDKNNNTRDTSGHYYTTIFVRTLFFFFKYQHV